jgi:hypothetical protein
MHHATAVRCSRLACKQVRATDGYMGILAFRYIPVAYPEDRCARAVWIGTFRSLMEGGPIVFCLLCVFISSGGRDAKLQRKLAMGS